MNLTVKNDMKKLTVGNLNLIWKQLDNASSNLYNATDNIMDLPKVANKVDPLLNRLDISLIDSIKNEIEAMIDQIQQEKEIKAMEKELHIDQ